MCQDPIPYPEDRVRGLQLRLDSLDSRILGILTRIETLEREEDRAPPPPVSPAVTPEGNGYWRWKDCSRMEWKRVCAKPLEGG